MTYRRASVRLIAFLLAAAAVLAVPAAAQEEKPRQKYGFFVGVHMTRFSLGGDFDGVTMAIPGDTEAFILPSFTAKNVTGYSVGFGTGRGGRDRVFIEVRHYEANPAAVYQGEAVVAKASNWSAGVRYMYTEYFIQPYVRGGFTYGRIRVAEGTISDAGDFSDSVFLGGGLDVALGAAIWLPPCFSIFAEGSYSGMDYRNVKGTGDSWNLMGISGAGLGGGGLTFAVGLQIMY